MLAVFHADGPNAATFKAHQDRLLDYLWISADGMKMQGYNGSQLWDTAFSVQAILETGLVEESRECLTRAYEFIDISQVREDVPQNEKYYRHISKGCVDAAVVCAAMLTWARVQCLALLDTRPRLAHCRLVRGGGVMDALTC